MPSDNSKQKSGKYGNYNFDETKELKIIIYLKYVQ